MSKAADLNWLVQGGQLYRTFPSVNQPLGKTLGSGTNLSILELAAFIMCIYSETA